jgi:hypothetical protein
MIYDSPDNADFKRRRPNPNLIQPGDVLILPDVSASFPPSARLWLPCDFASQLELPGILWLDPIPRLDLPRLTPQLFPPSQPAFSFGPLGSPGGGGATWGGPVYDNPVNANGEPIHGGYSDALKWSGKAILKYPWVQQRLDVLKDGAVDFAWRSAPWWQRGLEIGLGVGAGTALLSIKPSREFIRDKLHGTDIPLSPLGLDWLSIQPRLGVGGDWGGVITFDLQDILNPAPKKKKK